jgi:hypothetical protein
MYDGKSRESIKVNLKLFSKEAQVALKTQSIGFSFAVSLFTDG